MFRFIKDYKERKRLAQHCAIQTERIGAAHMAVNTVFHNMISSIGIDEMEKLLAKAKIADCRYVNLTQWYIEALENRRRDSDLARMDAFIDGQNRTTQELKEMIDEIKELAK